jgi:hypothetical protein
MSGELVGEVFDAAEAGRLEGLSRPAFAVLLAIAERCHHVSRQGTVRIDRMRAAIYAGNSERTARRAIRELKDAGLIRVVKRGYKAPNGEAKSSMYEMAELAPSKVAEASDELVPSKVAETRDQASAKPEQASAKSDQASATQGGALNGPIDGPVDGGACATDAPNVPAGPEPNPYCSTHMPDGTTAPCVRCGTARRNLNGWRDRRDETIRARDEATRLCRLCDDRGYIGLRAGLFTNCPHDPKAVEALERQALEALERQEKQDIDA